MNATVRELVEYAYQRHAFDRREVTGGPAWIDADRFDVVVKAPPNTMRMNLREMRALGLLIRPYRNASLRAPEAIAEQPAGRKGRRAGFVGAAQRPRAPLICRRALRFFTSIVVLNTKLRESGPHARGFARHACPSAMPVWMRHALRRADPPCNTPTQARLL
jgi:hypothetical protein